jgi:glycosyltransferase involved in cell wall biosynthesis
LYVFSEYRSTFQDTRDVKIAITSTVSWPYIRRGSRITYELAVYLARQGHDVHYISIKPGRVTRKRMQDGVAVQYHRLIDHPLLSLCKVQKLDTFSLTCLGALLREDYDIVQSTFPMDAFAASLYKSLKGTPFVHYMFDRFYPKYYITKYGGQVFSRCMKTASGVVTISNFIKDDLKAKFGVEGVVIPGTVDVEQFTLCQEKDYNAPYILSTSSLQEPRKRIDLLVKAFERLLDFVPDATLKLSGHTVPSRTRALLESVSPRTRESIEILGVGSREDLPGLYRNASVTVLPSVDEAFGLVILESLASGTPVVGTRSGGISDILTDSTTGVLFEETGGPEELCKALLQGMELNRNPETRTHCRNHAEQYSWSNIGPLYEQIYFDILENCHKKKRGMRRKKNKENKVTVPAAGSETPASLFDDALDELDIDYDTYYRFDHYKPLCTYIAGWLFNNGVRMGSVLVIGNFISPLSMLLKKHGFSVREVKLTRGIEPWDIHENKLDISDLDALKNLPERYDVIICDDILHNADYAGRLLLTLREKLQTEGTLLITVKNARNKRTFRRERTYAHQGENTLSTSEKKEAHSRQCHIEEVRNLVSDAGFSVNQHHYIIPVFMYVRNRLRYFVHKSLPILRNHIFLVAQKNGADV